MYVNMKYILIKGEALRHHTHIRMVGNVSITVKGDVLSAEIKKQINSFTFTYFNIFLRNYKEVKVRPNFVSVTEILYTTIPKIKVNFQSNTSLKGH